MPRLSSPIGQMKPHYTVVVVGSGYGGAIMACRLAESGIGVCVLERGREFQPGEYPDTLTKALLETQWDFAGGHVGSRTGLYDFHVNDDISVFVGCGLGGTSLIHANVALFPKPDVFDQRWPEQLRSGNAGRAELDRRLDQARKMLEPRKYPGVPSLVKFEALKKAGKHLGEPVKPLPITVTFKDRKSRAGIPQEACKLCGDCVSGCNYGSKNTLIMNYLPYAKTRGAELYTHVAVRYVKRRPCSGWLVYYQLLGSGRENFDAPTMFLAADVVVLAAGTLGSTEILLRSRDQGLPVSDNLGYGFSGNGDFLVLGYNGDEPIHGIGLGSRGPRSGEPPVGPGTTGWIDLLKRDFLIEEGVIPGAFTPAFAGGLAIMATLAGRGPERGFLDSIQEKLRRVSSCLRAPHRGALRNTFTYLVMGYDEARGEMCLKDDRLRVAWPGVNRQRVFQGAQERVGAANERFRGTCIDDMNRLVTVHPLGGCRMADDAKDGVVNDEGQVFRVRSGPHVHEDLYVCDGSVVPRSLGVNPFMTIAAIAERTAAHLVARLTGASAPCARSERP